MDTTEKPFLPLALMLGLREGPPDSIWSWTVPINSSPLTCKELDLWQLQREWTIF